MDEQARLHGDVVVQRLPLGKSRNLASALGRGGAGALRLARLTVEYSQVWNWRYGALPVAAAVALALGDGRPLVWRSLALETLAVVCALAGWAVARASHTSRTRAFPYLGTAITLLVAAGLTGLAFLAGEDVRIQALGGLAALALLVDMIPTSSRARLSGTLWSVMRRLIGPALLGVGLVAVTAQSQGARLTATVWLVGGAFSLATFAAIQAREVIIGEDGLAPAAPWRSGLFIALALPASIALLVVAALPPGAPHGMLAALLGLPPALLAIQCLLRSTSEPARAWAANRLDHAYTLIAFGAVAGALASAAYALFSPSLFSALGW